MFLLPRITWAGGNELANLFRICCEKIKEITYLFSKMSEITLSRLNFGFHPVSDSIFEIFGTRRCMSSYPSG
jgi:CRISPR/Cas system-associated endonuclease Cas3-HD